MYVYSSKYMRARYESEIYGLSAAWYAKGVVFPFPFFLSQQGTEIDYSCVMRAAAYLAKIRAVIFFPS